MFFKQADFFNLPKVILDDFFSAEEQSKFDTYLHPKSRLFINDGHAHFTEQSQSWQIADTKQGRGVACFDYDRDGDIDVVIANNQDAPSFYANQIAGNAQANFINIRLVGLSPNTQALGAVIKIKIKGKQQMREVNLNSNYLSHNLADAHFGLGTANIIDELTVIWPKTHKLTTLKNVSVNQFLVLASPDLQAN